MPVASRRVALWPAGVSVRVMQDSLPLICPHCGESFDLALDASEGSAEFTVDCEVCCRPMLVSVRVKDGMIEGLDVIEE